MSLVDRGIRVEFVKEALTFDGCKSAMAKLLLSVMGAFAEFERSIIKERQAEGIALAKQRGVYKGRKRSLTADQGTAVAPDMSNPTLDTQRDAKPQTRGDVVVLDLAPMKVWRIMYCKRGQVQNK